MKQPFRFPRISPSTRAFFDAARDAPGSSPLTWLHGYIYGRWIYLYIGLGTGQRWPAKPLKCLAGALSRYGKPAAPREDIPPRHTFADTYHGKVVTLDAARQLVRVDRDVELRDLEHVVPYTLARDIVLRDPDHIVALECPCRAARPNPCLPMDVCLIVGEPFASFVLEHHGGRARPITSDEASEILSAEHARGHVQHAFFKDAMLGRFYAICNCCSCCCGALNAHRNGTPMLAASGYLPQVEADLCIECGACEASCQFGAITASDGPAVIDAAACMGCGVCVDQCPEGALTLARDSGGTVPLELDQLMAAAARAADSP